MDVTNGRKLIKEHQIKTGVRLSFTAWLLKCIGHAVNEHKDVHSMMKGKKQIVTFDEVDISITIEKKTNGKKVPMALIIRKTNEKSVREIHDEIRAALSEEVNGESVLGYHKLKDKTNLYVKLPRFVRMWFLKRYLKDPLKAKEFMGTVVVTAVGMFGMAYWWPIPTTSFPLAFAIGGIIKKPGVIKDKIEIREYLTITILFNHDIVDGAPATRFTSRLVTLIEEGYGLEA